MTNNDDTHSSPVPNVEEKETPQVSEQPLVIPPTRRQAVRTSMLGMVWNANDVLELALDPNTKDCPQELFETCKGIVIMAQSKAGFLFTGHCGTGVMMAKQESDEENGEVVWSPPVAIYNAGYSMGAVVGYKQDNYLIFIMDDESMQDFAKRPQTRIGVVASCTMGKAGGELECGMNKTFEGKDSITLLITKGAFTGGALEMETFETCQDKHNHTYYNDPHASVRKILFEKGSVTVPKESLVPDLHSKLRKLARGETWIPGDLDKSRSGHFYALAENAEKKKKARGSEVST